MDGSTLPPRCLAANDDGPPPPILCFSHLRWDSVFQRPQQLLSRFAASRHVVFVEEPVALPDAGPARLDWRVCGATGVVVATPRLPSDCATVEATLRDLTAGLMTHLHGRRPIGWYYTPMALPWSSHLPFAAVVYDCMDELSAFRFAPAELKLREQRLLHSADLVFTGGRSLYEAKRRQHRVVHCFPSGVDLRHFGTARQGHADPADQAAIGQPRLGYFGVIDERIDLALLAAAAAARPDWQFVMLGPLAKLREADLPRAANLHWLGGRPYAALPAYLANWDVALMPFALNDATRFISPTKAPEYLAGGRRVVSTGVADVVSRFAGFPEVQLGDGTAGFIAGCETALAARHAAWRPEVDALLAGMTWDSIVAAMTLHLDGAVEARARRAQSPPTTGLRAAPARPALTTLRPPFDTLVVGAGFAGAVMAERLASDAGQRVLVVDRRPHIAGNAFDEQDAEGLLVHRYGPHIFHSNSAAVVRYLSRFTTWRQYAHRVLAAVGEQLVPMPINRTTLNMLYGAGLETEAQAAAFLAARAEPTDAIRSAEDFVVAVVGRDLYETFFRGYSRKQWGVDPSQLDKSVTARVPTRTSDDDRYFTDDYQCMPRDGYTRMFENMLDHRNITLVTDCDYATIRREARWNHLVFTGPIDGYFGHRFGPLPYRSLRFTHSTLRQASYQPVGTVNYPSAAVPYTRITEFKHLTGQVHAHTSICHEYPAAEGDPYYPVPNDANQALFRRYQALADAEPNTTFLGRLGSYRYFNMDQVVAQALAAYRRLGLPSQPPALRQPVALPAGE